jgi:hypothetical protein
MMAVVLPRLTLLRTLTMLTVLALLSTGAMLLTAMRLARFARFAWRVRRGLLGGRFCSTLLAARPAQRTRTAHAASLVFVVRCALLGCRRISRRLLIFTIGIRRRWLCISGKLSCHRWVPKKIVRHPLAPL